MHFDVRPDPDTWGGTTPSNTAINVESGQPFLVSPQAGKFGDRARRASCGTCKNSVFRGRSRAAKPHDCHNDARSGVPPRGLYRTGQTTSSIEFGISELGSPARAEAERNCVSHSASPMQRRTAIRLHCFEQGKVPPTDLTPVRYGPRRQGNHHGQSPGQPDRRPHVQVRWCTPKE